MQLALQAEKLALYLPLLLALAASGLVAARELLGFSQRIARYRELQRALRSMALELEASPGDAASQAALRSKLNAILEEGEVASWATRERPDTARVYISYRRDDSTGYAGRLFDGLTARLGSDRVTMDIDSILPGQDFQDALSRQIEGAGAVLVLIGPDWLADRDATGQSRLSNPTDFVHAELKLALSTGRRIIPVLVGGAQMPLASELPEPLQGLVRRQAIELGPRSWESDVQRLVDVISRLSADVYG